MNTVMINGVVVSQTSGNNSSVVVSNGRVIINGKDATPNAKEIKIEISGNVDNLEIDSCNEIKISGAANKVKVANGNVVCGDVTGNVNVANGKITCGDVRGDVEATNGKISRR